MRDLLKAAFRRLGLSVHLRQRDYRPGCVSLAPHGAPKGRVLIAYILDPFLLAPGAPAATTHTHHGESLLIAQVYLELGYSVDVIDYRNDEFIPNGNYDFFVSARTQFERIARLLNPSCIKIAHLDTAHFLFNNAATYARALALQQRRGQTCTSLRIIESNRAIECADYGALLGGEYLAETYAYAQKPLYSLPIPTVATYAAPEGKDYDACRRRFLWFGSSGLIHKGLDLVLEAFAPLEDYELLVAGPIEDDLEFRRIYERELYGLRHIRTVGWLDVTKPEFTDMADRCIALVFPSCAESASASSLTCMQAGLIPILSREAGVAVGAYGRILEHNTIGDIQETVRQIAALPAIELKRMSHAAWQYAHTLHTKENYLVEYRKMVRLILAAKS